MATTSYLMFLTFVAFYFILIPSSIAAQTNANSSSSKSSAVVAEFLNSHNKIRAQHGLPLLKWSASLANFAKNYANQRRNDCRLIHSPGDLGENLFWGQGKRWTPSEAVELWAAEKVEYNYKSNRCIQNKQCLHYTQLVWRTTTSVGCAKVICRSGDSFIACEYYPHGNTIGQRPF